ncbi:MAG TPA: CHAT domain-containing protein [Planctomycetes bacterium]|nr:CHAT domain-containing protein [Planctomycetota bacterium]
MTPPAAPRNAAHLLLAFLPVVPLGIGARSRPFTPPLPQEDQAPCAGLDGAVASFLEASRPEEQIEALRGLEEALTAAGERGDEGCLGPWFRAFNTLRSAEAVGWPLAVPSVERLMGIVLTLTRRDDRAGSFEIELVSWLLHTAEEQNLEDVPHLESLLTREGLERYLKAEPATAAWVPLLAARCLRAHGESRKAEGVLDALRERLVSRSNAYLERAYLELETASCEARLGRWIGAGRFLADAEAEYASWPAAEGEEDSRKRELREALDLAWVRQGSSTGRYPWALDRIARMREEPLPDSVRAQLDYYEAVCRRHVPGGDADASPALLRRALDAPSLPAMIRGLALLEQADLELERGANAEAGEALRSFRELASLEGGERWPLQRARSGILAARLGLAVGECDVPSAARDALVAYRQFLDTWKGEDEGAGVGILAFPPRRRLLADVLDLCLTAWPGEKGVRVAMEESLRARSVGSLAGDLGASPPGVSELRSDLLCDGDVLLVLMPTARATHAFALTKTELAHARLPSMEDLDPAIESLWRDLGRRPVSTDAPDPPSAGALADLLFPPKLAALILPARRLLVVGNDLLRRIPLDVLPLPGVGPLGLRRQVVTLPSSAVALALVRREGRTTRGVVALIAAGGKGDPARFSRPSQDRIEAAFADEGVNWLEGDRARLSSIAELRDRRALLVFAHGLRDRRRALSQGLRLARGAWLGDGELFPGELDSLTRSRTFSAPPLVLLASCDAAGGEVRLGAEDSGHLGASFLRAGARTVLLSAVPLQAEATSRLCAGVLEGVHQGLAVSEALRRARVELRSDPRFHHPHYWGTWIAWGAPSTTPH